MIEIRIMLSVCLWCLFFAEWSGVMATLKWYLKTNMRIKPLDCAMCLTFWVTLCLFLYLQYGAVSVLLAGAASAITVLINAVYERITKR